MTPEEIKVNYETLLIGVDEKAKALSLKRGVQVHGYCITVEETSDKQDYAVAFIEEPKRTTKLRVADKMVAGATSAGSLLVESCMIKEDSDPRFVNNDTLYLTLCNEVLDLIQIYTSVVKKN